MPQVKSGFLMSTSQWRTPGPESREKAAWWWCVWLLLVFLASSAHGQAASGTQSAPEAPAPAPTVSANVDEVSLDMVVHDSKHKLVLDLKPAEIAVTDNGTPVTLSEFRLVNRDANAGHLVTVVFDPFGGPAARNAGSVANKILDNFPSKGYSFALLDLTGRLRLIQGFTEDWGTIEEAVRIVTGKDDADRDFAAEKAEKSLIAIARTGADPSGTHVDLKVRAHDQTLLAALADAQRIRQDQHTLPALAGLLALVRSQQRVAERKCIIYFTQNRQMDSAAKEMVNTIAGAANQAGVTIYVVDMNALDQGGQSQVAQAMAAQNNLFNPSRVAVPGSGGMATYIPPEQAQASGPTSALGMVGDFMRQDGLPFTEIKSPLADLAKNTGGAYIDAQNSLKKPLQQILQDMTMYYQASYIPPIQEYDGTFRAISVKPMRAGLDIKTKTGYFALPPSEEGGIRPFEAPLLRILSQPQLPNDMNIHAAVLQFGELPDGNTSTLAVEVPLSQLLTKEDTRTGLYSAHVSIVAQIKDKSGTVIEHYAEDIVRRGALESIAADKSAAIGLQRHFMAIPGQYAMEVAVLDQLSGRASAQRVEFEIPQAQSTPSLSQIVLVRKVDAFHEEDDPLEPLRFGKGKVTPNLSGQLPDKANSVSLFFILHPDPKASDPPTLELEVSRNGVPGRRAPLPLPDRSSAEGNAIPYMADFRASSLAPGIYTVKATMSQGGKTAEREFSFFVTGPGAANAAAGTGSAPAADAKLELVSGDLRPATQLVITPLTNPVPPPAPEEIQAMISDAKQRAVSYADSLPNFMCVEVTDRSSDFSGTGMWRHRDTIAELLRYLDKTESRTMLEVNGSSVSSGDRDAMEGTFSTGEFGGVLQAVFQPSAKAEFHWKEADALGGGTVQVFDFRVAKENSVFRVTATTTGQQLLVSFHGLVFIDSATRSVRRITLVADDLPKDFPTRATSIAVDYDYVVINGHDYLMPVAAEVRVKQGRHQSTLNTIEFRDYRRYASSTRILNFTPVKKP